jgi:pyruvate dehydrogenase E2 component (dihydrolipoamide acetyltransferase)
MEKPIAMPKLGMTMTEGTILNWLYQEGDMVEKGEPLVEVMTDKVNLEVEAPFSGRLSKIMAQDGDVLPVGQTIALVIDDTADTSVSPEPMGSAKGSSDAKSAIESSPVSAEEAVAITPAILTQQTGDSERVASTPAAKREAAVRAIDLRTIIQAGATPPLTRDDVLAFVKSQQKVERQTEPKVRATPVAQKMAQEHQVDLAELAALKAGSKVTRADIEAHLANGQAAQKDGISSQRVLETPTQDGSLPDYELIPLSPVRRLIGQRMQASITTAPHIYLDTEIDMTEAERWRQHVGRSFKARNAPAPSMTAILMRASAAALELHPAVNSAFAAGEANGKDAIKRWHIVNIGVAVDTEQALLTPVVRNAHQLSLPEIASELRRVTQQAREGKLKPEDLAGATFTISNLGMYGIDTFHAIIAPGQSAILAVGKISKHGVVIEDEQGERIEIRPIMKVSLSADHRILDGASGSRFLQQFKAFLEDPYLLL